MVSIVAQNVFDASSSHGCVCLERETDGASKRKTTVTNATATNSNYLRPCPVPKHTWRQKLEVHGVHKKPHTYMSRAAAVSLAIKTEPDPLDALILPAEASQVRLSMSSSQSVASSISEYLATCWPEAREALAHGSTRQTRIGQRRNQVVVESETQPTETSMHGQTLSIHKQGHPRLETKRA